MKFPQMPYTRLDFDHAKTQAETLTAQLRGAESYAEAKAAFLEWDKLNSHMSTLSSLAYVRHTINTEDEFYSAEKDYYDEISPQIQELEQNFTAAMLESSYRSEFEAEYGPLYFINAEIERRTFKPELIEKLQEENKAASEYVKLVASAQIEFRGETLTLSQLTPHQQSTDAQTRKDAWNAYGGFFMERTEQFDDIFGRLVSIRDSLGKALGHSTFTPLGYDRMGRNCYREGDVERFRAAVIKHIVPVAARLKEEQARRNGFNFPMTYPDDAVQFPSGNAKPFGTPEQILAHGQKMYRELSPETAGFIDFMMDRGLFDVLSRKGKASGGYCTNFPDYKSPFIFANFNGTAGDIDVMTHEAGHAFAVYQSRDIVPGAYREPTMEACEVHSMTMEFFAWPWCEGFFGADTNKYYYQHLESAFTFIPYGTMVDHFQ
ncbi:MAG: M3 family oligoendopeptidase, partial [Oscillospiraceae bacterium]|nr:M3 family oligoendopeptidase [Oscillospiraceae bacterium]